MKLVLKGAHFGVSSRKAEAKIQSIETIYAVFFQLGTLFFFQALTFTTVLFIQLSWVITLFISCE